MSKSPRSNETTTILTNGFMSGSISRTYSINLTNVFD